MCLKTELYSLVTSSRTYKMSLVVMDVMCHTNLFEIIIITDQKSPSSYQTFKRWIGWKIEVYDKFNIYL